MTYYSIEQVCAAIAATRVGTAQGRIQFLLTDSRSLCFPEETLFFALKTAKGDGADYIPELLARGVRNFVVGAVSTALVRDDVNFLVVDDVLRALQTLAQHHRRTFAIPVVGITGSNGKTIVKEWLAQLLAPRRVTRSPRSYNSQIGVPLSLWLIDEQTDIALIEAGISQRQEMARLEEIIRPTVGVFTFLGAAHQEHFASLREKCLEKLSLFANADEVIVGIDDPVVRDCLAVAPLRGKVITWAQHDASAQFVVRSIAKHGAQTTIAYRYEGHDGEYSIPFCSAAAIENSITCALTALRLGVSRESLAQRMPLLDAVAMRLEVVEGRNGITIINDSYNSDINSLTIALDFLQRRAGDRRRTLILSDILQTGSDADTLYSTVGSLLAAHAIDTFIGIGDALAANKHHITTTAKHFFPTVEAFLASSVCAALSNEVVLLKGARQYGFERIEEALAAKVHQTTLEVNLDAVVANLNFFRAQLPPGTKLTCMIKADAYGMGAIELAQTLQEHHVDYLAVAVADEGVVLRRHGITQSIIVMNPEQSAFKTLFAYDLEPEIYSFPLLEALIASAAKAGRTAFPCHIKLDTGMCRLGFDSGSDLDALIHRLQGQSAIIPRSVFSHFFHADSAAGAAPTAAQFARFDRASRRLQEAFPHTILRHICNTAAILAYPSYHLDMCRLGIGLYGINPLDGTIINNVATLTTVILQIRDVEAGESIGYGGATIAPRALRVAVLPIGYADGVNRLLGRGRAYCMINGCRAPYVGNICMDLCMVDVSDIACAEGDRVEIFGSAVPVSVLAAAAHTIPYEILTSVSARVKRIYFKE